jgi:hypothetical protein
VEPGSVTTVDTLLLAELLAPLPSPPVLALEPLRSYKYDRYDVGPRYPGGPLPPLVHDGGYLSPRSYPAPPS